MTTCPNCKSFRLWKYGIRKNKRGTFQKFFCKDCKRQFIDDDFLWMQTTKEVVAFAIRHWRRGYRPSWIVQEIWIVFKIRRSVYALFYWVRKFLPLFDAINSLPLHGISPRLHWDYTYIKIAGEDAYWWALKDAIKKCIVGWIITTTRTKEDAKASLREAKRRLPTSFDIDKLEIVSDGEQSFPRAIKEVFGYGARHYRYKGFKDKKNNNLIEELWRAKNYVPEFRTVEQAIRFFTIWTAFYNIEKCNYVRESYEAYKLEKIINFRHDLTIQVL